MQFLGVQQFKMLHLDRSPLGFPTRRKDAPIVGVRKQSVEDVDRIDERSLRFTISTGTIDRDLDRVDVTGWHLDNFRRNPVVLWSHRADELPIGKCADVGADQTRLFATVQFLPMGYGSASDVADTVYRMACDGWLNATSVGFRPMKWDFTADKDRGGDDFFPGIDFHEQELVELSIVAVPSNPDALIEPGGGDNDSAPVITPAPIQVISHDAERLKRRARAALLGVFPRADTDAA